MIPFRLRYLQILFLVGVSAGIAVSFQNCGQVGFVGTGGPSLFDAKNNGGVYGGKPEGTFYRFTPDYTCESTPAPVASLLISNSTVTLTENKKLLCGVRQNLDPSLVDGSIYQRDVVGYLEGIFQGDQAGAVSVPANLVEVWCKDQKDPNGAEALIHYDREKRLAVGRIYFSTTRGGVTTLNTIPDFVVARTISERSVLLVDQNGFRLSVDRNKPSPNLGLFQGHLDFEKPDGTKFSQDTDCRLGGSLDAKVWPVQQIVDANVDQFDFAPDMSEFTYSGQNSATVKGIFRADPGGRDQRSVSGYLSPNYMAFKYTADSAKIIYTGQDFNGISKFWIGSASGTTLLGNLDLTTFTTEPSSPGDLLVSADNQMVVVKQNYYPGKSGKKRLIAKSVNDSRPAVLIQPPETAPADLGFYNFAASVSQGKVAFFMGDIYPDLFVSNFDGSGVVKINPPGITTDYGGAGYHFNWFSDLRISGDGKYVMASAMSNRSYIVKNFALAIDGSETVSLPENYNWLVSDSSGRFAVLQDFVTEKIKKMVDVKSGAVFGLPNLQTRFSYNEFNLKNLWEQMPILFKADRKFFAAGEVLDNGHERPVVVATADGGVREVCPGIMGSQVLIRKLGQENLAVVSYDRSSQIVDIFRATWTDGCVKVNSLAVTSSEVNDLFDVVVSADLKSLAVTVGKVPDVSASLPLVNVPSAQLYFVPFDGRPPYLVNSPVSAGAYLSKAVFTKDGLSLIYLGNQNKVDEKNVYRWDLPR